MSENSRVDLEKYVPSPEALREAADETAARERLQKALSHVEEDDLATPVGGAVAGLPHKATLGPVVAPPVTKRVAVEKAAPSGLQSPVRAVILAIVVVFFPVILVFVLFVKPSPKPVEGVAKTVSSASAPAPAVVDAGGGPPEGGAAAVPVVPPEASSAVVPVVPPAASSVTSGEPVPSKPKIKNDEPLGVSPPSPPKTSAPSVPPVPTATPSVEPTVPPAKTADPPPAVSAPDPFLRKRPQ